MSREIKASSGLNPSPTLKLTDKVGAKVIGVLRKKIPSKMFQGRFSYLIQVEDTDADTVMWNKETGTEVKVDVEVGSSVFLQGHTMLDSLFSQVTEGEKVEVIYAGKGEKKPGQKAPFLYRLIVHD